MSDAPTNRARTVDWAKVKEERAEFAKRQAEREARGDSSSGSGERPQFIKFKPNGTYNVRMLGGIVDVHRFYRKGADGRHYFAYVHPEDGQAAEEFLKTNCGTELRGQRRFAINAYDRDDNNVIKIMEGPYYSLFLQFADWSADHNDAEPGGMNGEDWRITVHTSTSGRGWNYNARTLGPSPFTPEQAKVIKETKPYFDLPARYAVTPIEELPKKLGLVGNAAGPAPSQQPQTAPVPSAPAPSMTTQASAPAAPAPEAPAQAAPAAPAAPAPAAPAAAAPAQATTAPAPPAQAGTPAPVSQDDDPLAF